MRKAGIFALALSAGLLPLGCNSSSTSPVSNAKEKIGEAAEATAAAAKAKRDEFAREMQKKLDELDTKIKALEQRASEAKGDAQKDLNDKVKVAKAKRDTAAKKLDELKEASHDRWEKVKDGVGNAFDDLKKAFD
ncbi:MAG: apolipoprotein A1/A4/E family protein [Planctomycetes bacterium]|nr:apolipoprotein A1/A4/E family protein [Planctomycetota bacterium]